MAEVARGYYIFAIWITRLAYLNILWVLFTIAGLVIFGIMPATVAMFSIVRKWQRGEAELSIFPMFWETYRQEFWKANRIGIILFLVGYLFSIQFQILGAQSALVYQMAQFSVVIVFALLVILIVYFFPVYVHFELKTIQYLKWPLIIAIVHPILTVFIMVCIGLAGYFILQAFPAILFFFGGSLTAYFITWGVSKTFAKYEAAT
ncbi:YesL family protein [Oceanobacillus sp. J11TS1]|uniref:YesL family protein n=1 Tax=Oceanobacillus sp. J11TS1 TaxID=2807191 RepID=UPI001B0F9044|nr:DUF624 domain-containing protein [Oceanobacillus sp. J11TS1]GIO24648.1 hypothetical protein J11TS1_32290 [Oceanobacillus sp. J11TS1]